MNYLKAILDTVTALRGGKPFRYSAANRNMYRIVSEEDDGSKTAYYFNSPIYRRRDRQLIDLRFRTADGVSTFYGSSASVTYDGEVLHMEDAFGRLTVAFPESESLQCVSGTMRNSSLVLRPTLNGIAVTAECGAGKPFVFEMYTTEDFAKIKGNGKYIAFMRSKFEPFFVLSGLYAHAPTKGMIPVSISMEKTENRRYRVTVDANVNTTASVVFEINLYEGKFFQDTTVESRSPDKNNCYGSVAFLGQTQELGEQWLYTKTSRKKVFDIEKVAIRSVRMYIPIFDAAAQTPTAFLPRERFCSFGSTWTKKIPCGAVLTAAEQTDGYYVLDLTSLLTDPATQRLRRAEGIVLRMPRSGDRAVIATGDCCMSPQILEVNYR